MGFWVEKGFLVKVVFVGEMRTLDKKVIEKKFLDRRVLNKKVF